MELPSGFAEKWEVDISGGAAGGGMAVAGQHATAALR
jgi:hypothetical protein